MWKFKHDTLHAFIFRFPKLDLSRQLVAISFMLLAFLYPGHNNLQTLVLSPGPIIHYEAVIIPPQYYPLADGVAAPKLGSRSAVVQDVASKTIMYERNPDVSMLPASTTKIMTALVARDYWRDLDAVLTVKNEDRAIGQTIELEQSEQLTIGNLLKGLLIHSGNDAALAIADNYPGGYSEFVLAMNQKAKQLHLDHTVYKNPSGIEQYGHFTTARDLSTLASIAMDDPYIREIVSTKYTEISDVTGTIFHPLETTNELLGVVPGLIGLKTGWTTGAGECLVSYVQRDDKAIVVVVLGSSDRFGDTRKLVDWGYDHHDWIVPQI